METVATAPVETESRDGLMIPKRLMGTRAENIAWGAILAVSAARYSPMIGGPETRNALPEPVDIANHIGNLSISFCLANEMARHYWGKMAALKTPEAFAASKKRIAIGVGALAVTANAFAETFGYGPASTPDTLDFVYGCLGAYIGYKVRSPHYLEPETVDYIDEHVPEEDSLRKLITRLRTDRSERRAQAAAGRKAAQSEAKATKPAAKNGGGKKKKTSRKQQRQARKRNR